jgi:chromosome partitioning protein
VSDARDNLAVLESSRQRITVARERRRLGEQQTGKTASMQKIMVYSESGGVSKTTTAVGLAMTSALAGKRTVLIDLDPRGAATDWLNLEPVAPGYHIGAILASDEDLAGVAEDLAVQSPWHENLRFIPSDRSVANREAERVDYGELRLNASLEGLNADVVVIDCPNRQGGLLTQSALTAADTVVYAATPNRDGVKGFEGAQTSVRKFKQARERMGAPANLHEAGIVVSNLKDTIPSRVAKVAMQEFESTGLLIYPAVPQRVIVDTVRYSNEWVHAYRKGDPIVAAYKAIAKKVLR